MTLKKITQRGAALVEYCLLTGFISIAAIGTVMSLGSKVSDTFDVAATKMAEIDIGLPYEVFGIMAPTGPVSDWTLKFDNLDAEAGKVPNWVTKSGNVWTVQLGPVFDHFPVGQTLYYDANLSQSGVRTVGSSGQCAYTLRPMSEFIRSEGFDQGILGGIASADSGVSDCTPLSSQSFTYTGISQSALVPSFAESIDLWTQRSCSTGATCEDGAMQFDIRFYTQ